MPDQTIEQEIQAMGLALIVGLWVGWQLPGRCSTSIAMPPLWLTPSSLCL